MMLGSLVSSIRSRLTARVGDESVGRAHVDSTDAPRNIILRMLNASYALVSQSSQDDAYCSGNMFMLPRVYSDKNSEHVGGLWSPVSLKAPEKSLDELDNVVEKFIRCISVESRSEATNVNRVNDSHHSSEMFRLPI